jgi:hypothetical protein
MRSMLPGRGDAFRLSNGVLPSARGRTITAIASNSQREGA